MTDINICRGCAKTFSSSYIEKNKGCPFCGGHLFTSKAVDEDSSELAILDDPITLDQKFKLKQSKVGYHYIPSECEEAIAECFHAGAQKYEFDSWKHFPNFKHHYYSALRRHLTEWRKGRKKDRESKQMHMAHIATIAIMILWKDLQDEGYSEINSPEAVMNLIKKIITRNESIEQIEEEVRRWFT